MESAEIIMKQEKEFNFQLLHGISSCNKNLEKWKIRANDKCDVCGSSQTVDHLLYNCNYVRLLWRLVARKVGIIISFEQILGLDPLFEYDSITTIISFLSYKEWLLLSLENKQRNADLNMMYYKSELQLRTENYKLLTFSDLMGTCHHSTMRYLTFLYLVILQNSPSSYYHCQSVSTLFITLLLSS